MSEFTTQWGITYGADPAHEGTDPYDGHGFTSKTGAFRSNAELRKLAKQVLKTRPDGRSIESIIREMMSEDDLINLAVDDIFQPEDVAAWALDPDTGLWPDEVEA